MRLRRARKVERTNKQVIDAIYDTVMTASTQPSTDGNFTVPIADLPDDAEGYNPYHLDRVAMRLGIRGIKVRTMTMHNNKFYFYKS